MEKRVLLEKRGRSPAQIKELVLDSCRSTSIIGVTDEFCNLEKLSMINVGLTNLKGFPKLPNLKKLELSDNRIPGGLNHVSSNCPKLQSLHLSGNKIDNVEALEPLKELTNLKYLELVNCEVASTENYRDKVFALLSNLKFLDGFDKNEEEADESDAENGETGNGGEKKNSQNEDEEDSELDEDEENLDEEDEESDDVGLSYLQKSQIDEESEGDDYSPEEVVDSDVEIDESEEEGESPRGEKRKHENDD